MNNLTSDDLASVYNNKINKNRRPVTLVPFDIISKMLANNH